MEGGPTKTRGYIKACYERDIDTIHDLFPRVDLYAQRRGMEIAFEEYHFAALEYYIKKHVTCFHAFDYVIMRADPVSRAKACALLLDNGYTPGEGDVLIASYYYLSVLKVYVFYGIRVPWEQFDPRLSKTDRETIAHICSARLLLLAGLPRGLRDPLRRLYTEYLPITG